MDYYRILGLNKSATKSEIKDAFRKLAIKFHPDKHTSSSKSVKDSATLKFKQVSEAYDVLSDDRKRADYNSRHSGSGGYATSSASSSYTNNTSYNNGYGSGYGYSTRNNNTGSGFNQGYGYGYSTPPSSSNGFAHKFGKLAHYLTTRDFLLHATFVGTMNYYKVLGVDKNATKSEIKAAFRKLAVKYHPDKHTASYKSDAVRAALLFEQISVAYNLLSDDSKRANYDLRHSGSSSSSSSFEQCNVPNCLKQTKNMNSGYNYGYGYQSYNTDVGYGYQSSNFDFASYYTCDECGLVYPRGNSTAGEYQRASSAVGGYQRTAGGAASKIGKQKVSRYFTNLNTRDFLLGAAFVGIILGGTIIIDKSRGLLWNLQNSGKSFEAAMDSIQKAKEDKDKK